MDKKFITGTDCWFDAEQCEEVKTAQDGSKERLYRTRKNLCVLQRWLAEDESDSTYEVMGAMPNEMAGHLWLIHQGYGSTDPDVAVAAALKDSELEI